MFPIPSSARAAAASLFAASLAAPSLGHAQELPESGVLGVDLVMASSAGSSQLYLVALGSALVPIPVGPMLAGVPSRWAHRRRTLGALETAIEFADPLVLFTPLGGAAG